MINKEDGRAKAREDWGREQAFFMVADELPRNGPKLAPERPFYLASLAGVDWAAGFCADYNAQIDALLAEFGAPIWAPGLRRLDASACLALLRDHAEDDGAAAIESLPAEARGVVQRVIDEWAWASRAVPQVALDRDRELLIVGRAIASSGQVWIDVIDLRAPEYMSHYEVADGRGAQAP